jgi:hypothetical protein
MSCCGMVRERDALSCRLVSVFVYKYYGSVVRAFQGKACHRFEEKILYSMRETDLAYRSLPTYQFPLFLFCITSKHTKYRDLIGA